MPSLLLVAEQGVADAAMRDVIASIEGVNLAWDVQDIPEALRLIEQAHPDAALFSHSLMAAKLLATIRATADKSSRTKILVVSMHNDSRFALRAIEAGASGYMFQDRAFEELAEALRSILSGRTYLSPGIAGQARVERIFGGPTGAALTNGGSPAREVKEKPGPSPANRRDGVHGPVRILVADDEEPVRTAFCSRLERAGYTAVSAATGEEAIALLRDEAPDLVFVDLVMPGCSGVQVIRAIRELDKTLPVIVITGYPDSDLMYQALAYSPLLVLAKPVGAKTLLDTVRNVLARRSVQSPETICDE